MRCHCFPIAIQPWQSQHLLIASIEILYEWGLFPAISSDYAPNGHWVNVLYCDLLFLWDEDWRNLKRHKCGWLVSGFCTAQPNKISAWVVSSLEWVCKANHSRNKLYVRMNRSLDVAYLFLGKGRLKDSHVDRTFYMSTALGHSSGSISRCQFTSINEMTR